MGKNDETPRRKRLECIVGTPLMTAFNKFKNGEDHESEADGVKALVREGLQRRGLMAGPLDAIQKP